MGIIANARLCSTPSLVSASSSRIGKFRSGMGALLLPRISGSRAFLLSGFRCIVKTWFPAFLLKNSKRQLAVCRAGRRIKAELIRQSLCYFAEVVSAEVINAESVEAQ